jgi:hypothetical protein
MSRLTVPEQIQGEWTNLIILTYSAHLDFFESCLLKQLNRVPNRLVLADDVRLAEQFAGAGRAGLPLRHANRTYLAAPIRNRGAAHAKAVLLTTASEGRLLVGSGNLGLDGYAEPGELWHVYQYADDDLRHRGAFAAIRHLADGIAARGWLDPIAAATLDAVWEATPWLPAHPDSDQPLRHNLDTPLIDTIAAQITGPVKQLTVHAPFYDENAEALAHLLDRLRPRRLRVLLTGDTSVNGDRLAAVIDRPGLAAELLQVSLAEPAFLHAKFFHIVGADSEVLVTGSANLSRRALLLPASAGNIEIGVIETRPRGGFTDLYDPLTLQPLTSAAELGVTYRSRPDEPTGDGIALLYSELHPPWLTVVFTEPVDDATFHLCHAGGSELHPRTTRIADERAMFQLDQADTEQLARGGRVQVHRDDADPVLTWPYHVDTLRNRQQRAADSDALRNIGELPELDTDLLATLQQLEQTLIFDRESAWRTTRPGKTPPPDDDDPEPGRWEDIDWERVYQHPRYRAYNHLRPGSSHATDIEIILAAIAARLAGAPQPKSDEDDDLGSEPADNSADGEEPDESPRERRARNRAWNAANRLVRRYTAGLQDETLITRLGPILTTHNAAIFNHLLRQLLDRDSVNVDLAIPAQLATWSFLWGDSTGPGRLASLAAGERDAVEQVLTDIHARQTTLGALYDLSGYTWYDADLEDAVARQTRAIVTSDAFSLPGLKPATETIDGIAWLAGPSDRDMITAVLAPWDLPPTAATFETTSVRRGGTTAEVEVLQIHQPVPGLSQAAARVALDRLAGQYTAGGHDLDYFRIRFATGYDVILWDGTTATGTCLIGERDEDFDELHPVLPDWWQLLTSLRN